MFSSLCAQAQRALVICCFSFMVFVVPLSANFSLFLRRRDKPRLLPDKMMRYRNSTPAVGGIRVIRISGNNCSSPNGRKQRQNLLPSRSTRGDEKRLFDDWALHDEPHASEKIGRAHV